MKIKVRNFGPIVEGYDEQEGYMEARRVTVFCGSQGSGKSSVAKLFSTLSWIEKALVRGDFDPGYITRYNRFAKCCEAQNIHNYFRPDTEIAYCGTAYDLLYSNQHFTVEAKDVMSYDRLQIAYIPAERNLLSAIDHVENVRRLPSTLSWTRDDFHKALQTVKGSMPLPVENAQIVYDKLNKVASVQPVNASQGAYKVRLSEACSGIQSVAPMYVVLRYLADNLSVKPTSVSVAEDERIRERVHEILADDSLDIDMRRILIEKITDNACKGLFAIIEEPEQNLYPQSQRDVLYQLIGLVCRQASSRLLITTHSPYMLDFLTLAIKAHQIVEGQTDQSVRDRVAEIVPPCAYMPGSDVVIYQVGSHGEIRRLPTCDGLPSDENKLNLMLEESNNMFDRLLDIEENLCQK